MKKQFFAVALAAGALMTSCQEVSSPVEEMGKTSFSVSVEDAVSSRAAIEGEGEATPTLEYTMEVYNADQSERLYHGTSADGNFIVELLDDKTYVALFWADASNAYNTDNLTAVALETGYSTEEAWAGNTSFTTDGTTDTKEVSIKRAVAKLTLKETGNIPAGSYLGVSFSEPTQFNVSTMAAGDESQNFLAKYQVNSGNAVVDGDEDFVIATDIYVLAPSAVFDITFDMYDQPDYGTVAFSHIEATNVPLKPNRNTNIVGHYITNSNFTLEASCSDTWETESDNQLESLPQGTTIPQE